MNEATAGPRSVEYWILRCCERLGLRETEFGAAEYTDQVRWLAYVMVRDGDVNRQ